MRMVVAAFFAVLILAAAPAFAQTEEEGRTVYEENCQSCHQPGGVGLPGTYPPLAGNPNVADAAYVEGVIRNGLEGPIEVLGQVYDGVMPPQTQLDDQEIQSVILYLQTLGGAPTDTTVHSGPVTGDAAAGEAIFLGQAALTNGGAACSSCHAAGAHGGASLGPDLTDVFSRLGGQAGLTAWLTDPPSPTMQPIFGEQPLEDGEIADLVAFFASIDGTSPDRGPDVMLLGAAAGLGLLLVAMALFFKRPKGRYVDQLRSKR